MLPILCRPSALSHICLPANREARSEGSCPTNGAARTATDAPSATVPKLRNYESCDGVRQLHAEEPGGNGENKADEAARGDSAP